MKRTYFVLVVLLGMFFFSQATVIGQEKSSNPFSLSCDLMSRYVWRGTDFGASPSIQPGISYTKGGLTVGAWGAYATNLTGVQEADLYLSYSPIDMLTFTVTDYFFPDDVNANHYFDYKDTSTGHIFEASVSFNGTKKLPFSILVASNLYGADAVKYKDTGENDGIQYSSYAELTYSFKNLDVFMGANLTSPNEDRGETGFYGDGIGIVNLGITSSRDIKLGSEYTLPLSISLITNPQAEKIYLVAGLSF